MTTLAPDPKYVDFLKRKSAPSETHGFPCESGDVHALLKPHQAECVAWAVRGGRRALFASFGLGKSLIQIETVRLTLKAIADRPSLDGSGRGLIVCPLGVRQEFIRDAAMVGQTPTFVRFSHEVGGAGIYLTNYESVRDGRLDPKLFDVVSLDEAACLRSFGSKTFGEFVFGPLQSIPYRFVATATPSPNDLYELIAYAAFLGIMDIGQCRTRFFKRNSEKAHDLTLLPGKEEEFWHWIASWALFLQKPSDLGPDFSDEGYVLPELKVVWHEVAVDHTAAPEIAVNRRGQSRLFREAQYGVSEAAREKRDTLDERVSKLVDIIRAGEPEDHWLIWHDLEAERHAIEKAFPYVVSVFGTQALEERECWIAKFSEGGVKYLSTKPVLAGSGCNFQRFCHKAVFVGIGFKFADFYQAIHRLHRFLQPHQVEIHIIYAESERSVKQTLLRKWDLHIALVERMSEIIREHGLANTSLSKMARAMGVPRVEACGSRYRCINNDSVEEMPRIESDSVGLVLTSIPFSTQYEYSPNFADFGHSDDEEHFFEQMSFLSPELLRVLMPGRILAVHCKDRVVPGGKTGLGFQTIYPFHAECIRHYMSHGFEYMGMKTICTDVVRENNQTYRLGWTEQCKDGTKMGYGLPEYLLIFRKAPTDHSNSYADIPVVKSKDLYTRARWQIDADGLSRSSGNRLVLPEELQRLPWKHVHRLFKEYNLGTIYDHEEHVRIAEQLETAKALPVDFSLIPARSWHPDIWSDITRMRSLNSSQALKGKNVHLCPLQLDICERAIRQLSNEGDVVLDPFGGLMSVPKTAVKLGRFGIGIELNAGYFQDGAAYCAAEESGLATPSLFDLLEAEEE